MERTVTIGHFRTEGHSVGSCGVVEVEARPILSGGGRRTAARESLFVAIRRERPHDVVLRVEVRATEHLTVLLGRYQPPGAKGRSGDPRAVAIVGGIDLSACLLYTSDAADDL